MALEQHNTAFEFETMLRRHLSQGGSMVEACVGFDADTASAYLENVLGQTARSRYESHLAGCPQCRHHVIELSRLIHLPEIIPQAEIQTTPVANPESTWSQWKTAAAGWLDFSSWKWGWATAGSFAAVLLAVLATQLWRQPQQANEAIAHNVPSAGPAASPTFDSQSQPLASPETLVAGVNQEKQPQTPARSDVPQPGVTPNQGAPFLAAPLTPSTSDADGRALRATSTTTQPGGALPAPMTLAGPVATSFGANLTGNQSAINFDGPPAPPPPAGDAVAAAEPAKIIAPINPSPSDNPMTRARKPGPTPTPRILGSFSFLASRKDEAGAKAELKEKEIEEGAPKLLTVRVRDKVFSFQSGMWVDHDYKPDMAWRVTKLVRDSDEYKQVLAAEPQLKEFFDRSSVIVVWKDKIFKVVAK